MHVDGGNCDVDHGCIHEARAGTRASPGVQNAALMGRQSEGKLTGQHCHAVIGSQHTRVEYRHTRVVSETRR